MYLSRSLHKGIQLNGLMGQISICDNFGRFFFFIPFSCPHEFRSSSSSFLSFWIRSFHPTHSQAVEADGFTGSMIRGDLHVQGSTAVAKVLGREDSTLLTDEEGGLCLVSH